MPELSIEEYPLRRSVQYTSKSTPSTAIKGPLKVLRLCLFSILLPGCLIAGPLYLRYHVYGDQLYPLAMSDMRLLDNKVSTTWCQRQLVKVNTTFNAFLLPEAPTISHKLQPLSMVRHLTLEDDMKEYWGFYLLKGSSVTVSTCVRWPGASLIVIRGHKHLHECAYIGDDSSEELDELMENIKEKNIPSEDFDENAPSNTPGMMTRHRPLVHFHNPDREKHENHTLDHEEEVEDHNTDPKIMTNLLGQLRQSWLLKMKDKNNKKSEETKEHVHKHRDQTINQDEKKYLTFQEPKKVEDSEEIFRNVLEKLKGFGNRGRDILEKLNVQLGNSHNTNTIKEKLVDVTKSSKEQLTMKTRGRQWNKHQIKYADTIDETNRKKRDVEISDALRKELSENDETADVGIEDGFVADGIADHRGTVNETTLNDRSNSEFWSSFSSSEEALLNCAGLILNLPLTPHRFCEKHRQPGLLEEASLSNTVTYRVPSNGYYFFVFNSENEVQENYIRVHFHLEKTVYNVSNSVSQCSNSTNNCALDLNFFSGQKLVLELPVRNNETLWNQEFVVLSECEPRSSLYIICVLAVPFVIILFAFQ